MSNLRVVGHIKSILSSNPVIKMRQEMRLRLHTTDGKLGALKFQIKITLLKNVFKHVSFVYSIRSRTIFKLK
jgi:hypothetical protein